MYVKLERGYMFSMKTYKGLLLIELEAEEFQAYFSHELN